MFQEHLYLQCPITAESVSRPKTAPKDKTTLQPTLLGDGCNLPAAGRPQKLSDHTRRVLVRETNDSSQGVSSFQGSGHSIKSYGLKLTFDQF